jgi:hypothetical protein
MIVTYGDPGRTFFELYPLSLSANRPCAERFVLRLVCCMLCGGSASGTQFLSA